MGAYIIEGKTIKEWSSITGLGVRLIRSRLRSNYDINAIFAKKRNQLKRGSIKNEVYDLSKLHGISEKAVYQRMNRGHNIDDIKSGKSKCSLKQSIELCIRRGEDISLIIKRFSSMHPDYEIIKTHSYIVFVTIAKEKTGLSRKTIYNRLFNGWSGDEILRGYRSVRYAKHKTQA